MPATKVDSKFFYLVYMFYLNVRPIHFNSELGLLPLSALYFHQVSYFILFFFSTQCSSHNDSCLFVFSKSSCILGLLVVLSHFIWRCKSSSSFSVEIS